LFTPPQPPKWSITPCQLCVTAYSVTSQVSYISGGHLLHPQPEDVPWHGDRNPHNMETNCNQYKEMYAHLEASKNVGIQINVNNILENRNISKIIFKNAANFK
jgi:hypothetical protein